MKTIPALIISSVLVLLIACDKDKFETKPRIEIKTYNAIVDSLGELEIIMNYFDKEGDLNEGLFTGIKERLNQFPPIAPGDFLADTFRYNLPEFNPKNNGEIIFKLPYAALDETVPRDDTIRFRFTVSDRAGNSSDTISTEQIIVRKPS